MHWLIRIPVWIWGSLVVLLFFALLQYLFSLGGAPEQEGQRLHYKLKPMMRIFLLLGGLGGGILIWAGMVDLQKGDLPSGPLLLAIGLLLIAGVFGSNVEFVMDESGILSHGTFRRSIFIPWNDLDHVEIAQMNNQGVSSQNYYLRSTDGKTIVVTDMAYNAADMLAEIRRRQPLPEEPYKRRKWYGG